MGTQTHVSTSALCVILSAGEIKDYTALAGRIPAGSTIICADSGLKHCKPLGVEPTVLVGDLDSVVDPPANLPKITCDAAEKDYTDTALAVEIAVQQGHQQLLLAGMLGGKRPDHSLANLQTLGWCAQRGLSAYLSDGVTDIYPLYAEQTPQTLVLQPKPHHYFSLVSLYERCGAVSIEGARYSLDRYPLRSLESPRAISNEFLGAPAVITLEQGCLLAIVTPMDRL